MVSGVVFLLLFFGTLTVVSAIVASSLKPKHPHLPHDAPRKLPAPEPRQSPPQNVVEDDGRDGFV